VETELWGINDLAFVRFSGRFDGWKRWFDPHRRAHILARRPHAYRWYQQQDGRRPIYLGEPDPTVPGAVVFPFEQLQRDFAHEGQRERFFTSTLDWCIALALMERFEAIELCWIRLEGRDERSRQRDGAHYWIGRARARGVRVVLHGQSSLFPDGSLYARE
jgi:hypothetical protein